MKYRQICVLGAAGVLTSSFSYQANAIKLDETTGLEKKSYMEVEIDAEESNQLDEESSSVANIYGIPTKEEKSKKLAQKAKKAKASKMQKKKNTLKDSFEKFSKNLSEEDFDGSVKIRNELIEEDGQSADDLSKYKISTVEIFKKQFSFPEVAKNDFSSGVLEELEISQKNLNSNLENVDLFNNFVETADKVKKQLKEKYGDQWTDPIDGPVPSEDQTDD